MKKKITFTLFGTFPLLMLAQATNAGMEHCFRAGDVLNRVAVILPAFSSEGEDAVWDLSSMVELGNVHATVYDGVEEISWMVTSQDGYERRSYLIDVEGASLVGRKGLTSRMTYNVPERVISFPMHYGDSIGGVFGGTGTYGDKLFVREYGRYCTKADASGCMALPDGDTLFRVSRTTTDRLVYVEASPSDSMQMAYGEDIPEYDVDSIFRHMENTIPLHSVREQRWYAEGYRYPILETMECRSARDGSLISNVALFHAPSVQESQLPPDEENLTLRGMAARGDRGRMSGGHEGGKGRERPSDPILSCTHHQDSETRTVRVMYSLCSPSRVRAVLTNAMGIVYHAVEQASEAGPGHTLTIPYDGLPHGQYVMHVSAGGNAHTAKFSVE